VSSTKIEEESIPRVPIPEFLSRDQNVDRFLLSLESFPERAGLGWADIQINSKLRRRVKRFVETLSLSQLSHLCHPLHASQPSPAQQSHGGGGGEDEEKIVVTVTVCRQLFSPTSKFCPLGTTILTPKILSMTKPTHPPALCFCLPPVKISELLCSAVGSTVLSDGSEQGGREREVGSGRGGGSVAEEVCSKSSVAVLCVVCCVRETHEEHFFSLSGDGHWYQVIRERSLLMLCLQTVHQEIISLVKFVPQAVQFLLCSRVRHPNLFHFISLASITKCLVEVIHIPRSQKHLSCFLP
jgi:hypothetical protein